SVVRLFPLRVANCVRFLSAQSVDFGLRRHQRGDGARNLAVELARKMVQFILQLLLEPLPLGAADLHDPMVLQQSKKAAQGGQDRHGSPRQPRSPCDAVHSPLSRTGLPTCVIYCGGGPPRNPPLPGGPKPGPPCGSASNFAFWSAVNIA